MESLVLNGRRYFPDSDGYVRWEPVNAAESDKGSPSADVATATPMIVRAYNHTRPPSRTQELLRNLPRGETGALLPQEMGARFSPPLSGVSVRQKVNNARKLEKALGAGSGNIVRVSWDSYNNEKAGRYYLSESDYDTLHAYLGDQP